MAKSAAAESCDCKIPLAEIAAALGASVDSVRAWVGSDQVKPDWSGMPATTPRRAAEVVQWHREDEARRRDEDRAATIARERRMEFVKQRYNELLTEAGKQHGIESVDHWPGAGGVVHMPVAGLVEDWNDVRAKALAQAEKEATRAGL